MAITEEFRDRNAIRASRVKIKGRAQYRNAEWLEFRAEVIAIDGGCCRRCGRTEADGVVLQVHHIQYHKGTPIWEYPLKDCLTVCKGCHAEEHGLIRPRSGWHLVCQEDLGDLIGTCEKCGTSIRHVFHIDHPNWEGMTVGTFCCDDLTGTNEASRLMRQVERSDRFIASPQWKLRPDGWHIKRSQMRFRIAEENGAFRVYVQEHRAQSHASLEAAKSKIFKILDDGTAHKVLQERGIPLEPPSRKGKNHVTGTVSTPILGAVVCKGTSECGGVVDVLLNCGEVRA